LTVTTLSAFALLLIATALIGMIGRWREDEGRTSTVGEGWIDLFWVLLLATGGVMMANHVHNLANPQWYPVGQDWREFVVLALDIQSDGLFHPVPQRYPFYPWLAVVLANLTEVPVHVALMQINLVAGGLIPAAVYRLGTAIGPRSLAVAGGWLAIHIPTVGALLGPPTDYLFHGLVHVVALSAGIRAFRSGHPGRWFGFGLALAILMATTMKSLVFLLAAAPLVLIALFSRARQSMPCASFSLFAWLLPMTILWQIYAGIPRWVTETYSLEYNVYRTQVVVARAHGRTAPLPTDLGWHPSDEKRRGYWGVGRPGAWSNLDKALTFLARGPEHNLPSSMRLNGATEGLSRALHLNHPGWLLLALGGCLAPFRRRPNDTHLGPILASMWITGITVAHFMGVMATHYIPRYAVVLLIPAPLLLLLGAAPWRPRRSLWLVPFMVLGTTLFAQTVPGFVSITTAPEVKEKALNPHVDFWAVRDSLKEGDLVVDLTGNRLIPDLWGSKPIRFQTVLDEEEEAYMAPHHTGRRVLIVPGALNMGDPVRQWTGATPGRLRELRPYVFEDTQPERALTLRLSRLGG
jgi:hypothetical protein